MPVKDITVKLPSLADNVSQQAATKEEQCVELPDGWHARIYSDWNFPKATLQAWDSLATAYGDAGIFLESGWFQQWWLAYGSPGRLLVIVLTRGDSVRGIFPYWRTTQDGHDCLSSLADDCPWDVLLDKRESEETAKHFVLLLKKLNLSILRWPAAMQNVPSTGNGAVLVQTLRKSGFPVWAYTQEAAPWVNLRQWSTWDEFEQGLHSKLRNNLKKGRRRAEKEGALQFELIRQPEDIDALLAQLFAVEQRSWKGSEGTAINCDPPMERFYRHIARWALLTQRLYIFVLRLNEKVIAFDFCLANGRTLYALKTGYDQEAADRFSPGNLMRREVLHTVFDDMAFDRYNFLGQCWAWKLEWTSAVEQWTLYKLYAPTSAGWFRWCKEGGWKEPLKRSHSLQVLRKFLQPPKPRVRKKD